MRLRRIDPITRFLLYARRKHIVHSWGRIQAYTCDHFEWAGLFWGWKHRYQDCRHPGCKRRRLVEGFMSGQHYYLRSGFLSEDGKTRGTYLTERGVMQ